MPIIARILHIAHFIVKEILKKSAVNKRQNFFVFTNNI